MGDTVQRAVFTTRDPAQALAKLDEVYALRDVRWITGGDLSMSFSSTGAGPASYGRLRLGGSSVRGTTEYAEVVRIGHVLDGVLSTTSGPDRFPRRGPFLFPQLPCTSYWADLDLFSVSVDGAAVAEQARQLLGADSFHLQFTGTRPVSPVMARYWSSTVAHLQRDLLPNAQVMSSPLVRSEMARSLITALLHTFPNTFLQDPPVSDAPAPRPAALRRAVSFIDANLSEDIGLPEIAAAARLSPRGVQAAFRRELHTTPFAYLRSARLEAVHRDLLAADPTTGATVEAVAARWGFAHRGRFAAAYRDTFGQAPSTTLQA
ncbi:helix-turn-helix transcriptional regulator [Kocuria arenosa]|jgi:AraC-like DNA-binding protein|uniref:AraC family transcriptional regulator n=1 Tax=Kocuria arenosa TaxID=3071446 RepID=UPI0034D416C1